MRVTALPDFVDPYLDPATGVLRNNIGAATQAVLNSREAELTALAGIELAAHPVKVTGDLRQLQAIHKQLFHDVYPWAGQLRTVDIRKGNDATAEFFMPVSRLQTGATFAFQELADDNNLRGLDRDTFIDRLAYHYDQVNYLHPFREGNGRTQRVLWTQVAREAGYDLDWRGVTGEVNDRASRDAMERQDFSGLRTMFATIVHPISEPVTTNRKDDLQRTVEALRSKARETNAPSATALTRSRNLPSAGETLKPPTATRRNYPRSVEKRDSGLERE